MPDYLKNLTKEQYTAATEIEGPMMVIAGPGTGKTQVLSSRIAHILQTTDTRAQDILVLTFTDSGTVAVRKRLQSIIGKDAYYVSVFTFHSFCENIISSYPDIFANLSGNVASDIDQISIIRSILDNNSFEKLKIIDMPYFYVNDIKYMISTLKREAVTPNDLENLTREQITTIQNDPNSVNKRTGKLKAFIQSKIKSYEKSLELAKVYKQYQTQLKELNLHDYDDMIVQVLDKIKNNEDLRLDLQEKYLYYLVDEYQDTNTAQNQIVSLLCNLENVEPNIFVVGDDDQSIYRFQGASLANIMYYKQRYPSAKTVVMTQSHRSTQLVLDTAMSVIKNNQERLVNVIPEINKNLTSKHNFANTALEINNFSTHRHEYIWLAHKIKDLVKSGEKYENIAIFTRNNAEIEDISKILLSYDIPVTSDKSSNILDDDDIRNLILLIRTIINPYDDVLFYSCVNLPYFNISTLDRIKLSFLRAKLRISYFEICNDSSLLIEHNIGIDKSKINTNNTFSLFDKKVDLENNSIVYDFTQFLIAQNNNVITQKFIHFFSNLIRDIDFTNIIIKKSNQINKLNKVSTLISEIKYKTQSNKNYSYQDFLNYIDILQDYNLKIPEKLLDLESNTVKIMTAHKSKGMEFPIIFIPKCIDGYWGNTRNRQNITLPDNILTHYKPTKDEKNEEERRLFYVALTRAKSQIYLTYADQYTNSYGIKNAVMSIFLTEIDNYSISKPKVKITEKDITREINYENFEQNTDDFDIDTNQDFAKNINEKIEKFKLNATALYNYLVCPRKFYYANILKIPTQKSDAQSFGTAMHKALELFFTNPTKEFLLESYQNELEKHFLTHDVKNTLLVNGKEALEKYYNAVLKPDLDQYEMISTEVDFEKRNVMLNNVKLTGKIDIVLKNKSNGEIILKDYKTGRIRSKNEIEKYTLNDFGELIPSRYYSQLMFYKILTDQDTNFKNKAQKLILDFIEGKNNKFKQEVFDDVEEKLASFKVLIHETYQKIVDHNFVKINANCKTCKDCPFNKICWKG